MTRLRAMQIGAITAGVSFALVAVSVWAVLQGQIAATPRSAPASEASAILPSQAGSNLRETNDVRVYKMVKEAVVNISASRMVTARVSSGNDLFDRMMPQALPVQQVQAQSLGSGFVIHSAGYIITNEHVVEEGTDVKCVFSSGEVLPAQVIATDNEHDLAVLKVTSTAPLHAISLGSTEDLMIGEPVYAIGNPYGYAGTMTRGIVSAVDRTLEISKDKSYKGLIQTDASINPGNSGGPLLNAYGQVVGINTAIKAGAQGIGFAISVSSMRDLLPAFLNPEALNEAQVGFSVEEKRNNKAPAEVQATVLIKDVQAKSGAAGAGLENGDRLLAIGTANADNVVDTLVALGSAKPGDTLDLKILRGTGGSAKKMEIKVPVTKLPPEDLLLTKMGITGQTLTEDLKKQYKLVAQQGVYVQSVAAGSAAAKCGIQSGDVLFQLGRYYVTSVENVTALLKTVKSTVDAPIGIIRGNNLLRGSISLK